MDSEDIKDSIIRYPVADLRQNTSAFAGFRQTQEPGNAICSYTESTLSPKMGEEELLLCSEETKQRLRIAQRDFIRASTCSKFAHRTSSISLPRCVARLRWEELERLQSCGRSQWKVGRISLDRKPFLNSRRSSDADGLLAFVRPSRKACRRIN